MVFDDNMDDFSRKAHLAVGGHLTWTQDSVTYSCMVPRETLYIILAMVPLHDLEVKAADILNAYIMVPSREKIWIVLSPEFEMMLATLSL